MNSSSTRLFWREPVWSVIWAYSLTRVVCFRRTRIHPRAGTRCTGYRSAQNDAKTLQSLAALDDAATRAEIGAERTTMRALNAGCSTPLGARAVVTDSELHLWAVVLSPDGTQRVFAEERGAVGEAVEVGEAVARQLLRGGAADLMISNF